MAANLTRKEIEDKIQALTELLKTMKDDPKTTTTHKNDGETKSKGDTITNEKTTEKDSIEETLNAKTKNTKEVVEKSDKEVLETLKAEVKDDVTVKSKEDEIQKDKGLDAEKLKIENTPILTSGQKVLDVKNEITLELLKTQKLKAYEDLKKVALSKVTDIVKLSIKQPDKKDFEIDSEIRFVENVPCFFRLKMIRLRPVTGVTLPNGIAKYVEKSIETFGYGVQDVRVEFASENLTPEINFDAMKQSIFDKIVGDKTLGAVKDGSSTLNYILNVITTMFMMAYGAQVIVKKVDYSLSGSSIFDSSDLIRSYDMIENKFINQASPVLPCGGYQNQAQYFVEDLANMFRPENHRMRLGEIQRVSFSQRKLMTTYACVTDQYFSMLNEMYIQDLLERPGDPMRFLIQLRSLTFRTVDIVLPNEMEFKYAIMPNYRRFEANGILLMYILSNEKQDQFLTHLRDLLNDTMMLNFRTNDQLLEVPMIRQIQDQSFKETFLRNLRFVSPIDIYFTLAADMSTTWNNFKIITANSGYRDGEPVQNLFNVFIVILWFNLFPAVAIDCAYSLMEILFRSLKTLCPDEVRRYLENFGYIERTRRRADRREPQIERYITLVSRDAYVSGDITFPFLTRPPPQGNGIMPTLRRLLELNDIEPRMTRDSEPLEMPRMRDIRSYILPWSWRSLQNVNNPDQAPTPFSDRLERITQFLIAVIKIYKNTYKDATSKSILGLAEPKAVSIFGFLQNFTSEFRNDVSATIHAHCNKLRELGQNSAYILDDTFRGGLRVRSTRPQLVITTGDNSLRIINTVRTEHDLAFEAPLYYLLHVYVSPDIQNVIITDPLPHYKNVRSIMREGRIFGDVVSYVRDIKYGNIGRINAEIQNLSPLITSVSATRLIEELGKQFGRDYSRIFSISMSNASVLIDPRGRGYKIVLNTYNGMDFDEEVDGDNTNPETLYNVELILERSLLTRMYATISKIFIPETSPIFLHVRGLFLESREVIDLNPMDYIEIQDWIAMHDPIIVMWSNSVVKQIPSEHERMTTRTVFQLIINGEQHNLFPERGYRKILFLLTNTTGTVSSANFSFILREFKNKRIAFLLTDTMVTINRVYATGVEADFNLESQFQTLLTSYMDSRVPITLLDTTSPGITFSRVPNKDKWIFLMTQYNEPDVVLTGMDDYLQPSRNYRICSPFMWAYGIDGKTVEVNQEENEFETLARDHDDMESIVVSKDDLRMINFNNNLTVINDETFIRLPTVEVVTTDVMRREIEADEL